MPKQSAGILPYRCVDGVVKVLIGHPGGPFWARKDDGAWSVIKGEYTDEDPENAARREFLEETGVEVPAGELLRLPEIRQRGGKVVTVFAVEMDTETDIDTGAVVSNTFEMEWPPRSGKKQTFPEIDRVAWFSVDEARIKLLPAQAVLLHALLDALPAP